MRLSMVKKGLLAIAALAALAVIFVSALPWVASTQIVRDRIAHELSLWSGYRVSLGEAPEFDVWPSFRATLRQVAFHEWDGISVPPVLKAERVDVSLLALPALRGEVVFSGMVMHSPLLRLTRDGDSFALPASPGGGRMSRAIDAARVVVSSNPSHPDHNALPSDVFGVVEFRDGRIALTGGDEADAISSLNGRIAWPSLNRPASMTANGIWRGESIAIEGASQQPLMLLAGARAPVKVSLKSNLFQASFEGVADLSADGFLDGRTSLSSPSLPRALEWSRTDIASGSAIDALSVAGSLQGTARHFRLDHAELAVGGNTGRGVLDLSLQGAVPAISGTLAFDRLDLNAFLALFAPFALGSGEPGAPVATAIGDQLSLDLRLSAEAATFGSVGLSDVAASAQVKGGLATFDVSDATAFEGTVLAGIRIDDAESGKTVEMRLMADDIDAFAFTKALGSEHLVPQGRASLSAILKGTGDDWGGVLAKADGSVNLTIGPGALAGFDLKSFDEHIAAGSFFALGDVAGGTLPFRGASVKAKVTGGVVRVDKADMLLDGQVATVSGVIPYLGRALALSGRFAPLGPDGMPGEPGSAFFIGGAWNAPYLIRTTSPETYE